MTATEPEIQVHQVTRGRSDARGDIAAGLANRPWLVGSQWTIEQAPSDHTRRGLRTPPDHVDLRIVCQISQRINRLCGPDRIANTATHTI
jgi:hypothetical protein